MSRNLGALFKKERRWQPRNSPAHAESRRNQSLGTAKDRWTLDFAKLLIDDNPLGLPLGSGHLCQVACPRAPSHRLNE